MSGDIGGEAWIGGVSTRRVDDLVQALEGEAETFWSTFLESLVRRGLSGVKLVISDAHEGLKAAIRRVFSASPPPPPGGVRFANRMNGLLAIHG